MKKLLLILGSIVSVSAPVSVEACANKTDNIKVDAALEPKSVDYTDGGWDARITKTDDGYEVESSFETVDPMDLMYAFKVTGEDSPKVGKKFWTDNPDKNHSHSIGKGTNLFISLSLVGDDGTPIKEDFKVYKITINYSVDFWKEKNAKYFHVVS